MSILELKNVSIRYLTGDFKDIGLKEYVMRHLTGKYEVREFWADRHISFSLEQGDMLGIIGSNGAGKSTLLKVVSGIMEPTEGYVKRKGSVSALLELGSGFDGELTVKENAYLRGAMLGYTRKYMDETYEQIISFSELREFEDRPFKQLSSGMKSRLAFSIASLLRPEILILDEVLSVGDGAFRKKSEAKMREIIHGGATTILVSHSLEQIRSLCNKILWLHRGQQIVFGDNVDEICDRYEQFLAGDMRALETNPLREMQREPANCAPKGLSFSLFGSHILEDIFGFHENNGGYKIAGAITDANPLWPDVKPVPAPSDWFLCDFVNVALRRDGDISPFEMTRPQLEEHLTQFVNALKASYEEDHIILAQTQYLNSYKTSSGFPAYRTSQEDISSRGLARVCFDIVRSKLPNSYVIWFPDNVFGDPMHPRGLGSLNYDRAYYDYGLKIIDSVAYDKTKPEARSRLLKAYSVYYKAERKAVQENSLESKLKQQEASAQ